MWRMELHQVEIASRKRKRTIGEVKKNIAVGKKE
jgi:hypothetical protein